MRLTFSSRFDSDAWICCSLGGMADVVSLCYRNSEPNSLNSSASCARSLYVHLPQHVNKCSLLFRGA